MSKSNPATTTEHKLTAAQVEKDCPSILQDLAQRIAVHFEKARKCEEKAEEHYTAVAQYLAKAKEACDDGGFDAFRQRFFPNLGQSRAYELFAIADGRKSVGEIKANTRARVEKHRANKAGLPNSVTVTEKSGPVADGAPTDVAPADAHSIVPDLAKPRRAVTLKDDALIGFTAIVCQLIQITDGRNLQRFAATGAPADGLAKLGKFLTDLAKLKKGSSVYGNYSVSAEPSGEDMKVMQAARAVGSVI